MELGVGPEGSLYSSSLHYCLRVHRHGELDCSPNQITLRVQSYIIRLHVMKMPNAHGSTLRISSRNGSISCLLICIPQRDCLRGFIRIRKERESSARCTCESPSPGVVVEWWLGMAHTVPISPRPNLPCCQFLDTIWEPVRGHSGAFRAVSTLRLPPPNHARMHTHARAIRARADYVRMCAECVRSDRILLVGVAATVCKDRPN